MDEVKLAAAFAVARTRLRRAYYLITAIMINTSAVNQVDEMLRTEPK